MAVWDKFVINQERKWTVSADGCLHRVKGLEKL
jgi:hypothetical protein